MTVDSNKREWIELPAAVEAAFAREAEGFDRYLLAHLYRALGGATLDADAAGLPDFLEREFGIRAETLERIAPIYGKCIGEASAPVALQLGGQETIDYAKRSLKPGTLDRAIEHVTTNWMVRLAAKKIARLLRGGPVPHGEALEELLARVDAGDLGGPAIEAYQAAIVAYRSETSARFYRRGVRRRKQQQKMSLVLPLALARRIPLIFNNQHDGPVNGEDPYGAVRCSEPLRSGAVGLVGYVLGIASHPDRFAGYKQIDDEGRVLTSQTRIYQALAAVGRETEPGGGGHRSVTSWIDQLDGLDLVAGVRHMIHGKSGRGPNLLIPSSMFDAIEKLVDGDDDLEWVPWSDDRQITKSAEYTLRFSVASWCLSRIGKAGEAGDRIYFDAGVWRCLSPAARAMYLETQGRRATRGENARFKYIEFYAADPWAMRFGMDHLRDAHREQIILNAFNELYKVDERVKGYARPWHGTNSSAKNFRVYLDGRSSPSAEMRRRLKRSDYLVLIETYAAGGEWPGRLLRSRPPNAPPDT